jgi:hypothetical protein
MRTWKVNFVPFWSIGERFLFEDWVVDAGAGAGVGVGSGAEVDGDGSGVGWERMVTRGTKAFQLGQVEVFTSAAQTSWEGALMKVELPMWRVAFSMGTFGVARVALVGSVRVVMTDSRFPGKFLKIWRNEVEGEMKIS